MNSITQEMRFRLSLIKYADKYGVTKAGIKYKTNRQYIYRLKNSNVIRKKFFQYTAIDEYSRWRFAEIFEEHCSCSSAMFLEHLVKAFPCTIECIQTDNGPEFTNRFTSYWDKPTPFQKHLELHGITHKLIKPYTPRHNGKVERSRRKDNERFYATHFFYFFEKPTHFF